MTEKLYRTEIFDRAHMYSGGIIYPSDFNTDYRRKDAKGGSAIAARIESDLHRAQNHRKQQKQRNDA